MQLFSDLRPNVAKVIAPANTSRQIAVVVNYGHNPIYIGSTVGSGERVDGNGGQTSITTTGAITAIQGGPGMQQVCVYDADVPADQNVVGNPARPVSGGGNGGDGLILSATLTLTDDNILHLLASPKTLVTPATGTAILPVAGWAVCDFTNGVYVDPDGIGDVWVGQDALSAWVAGLFVSDNEFPNVSPGATLFYQAFTAAGPIFQSNVLASTYMGSPQWTNALKSPGGHVAAITPGPLVAVKNSGGVAEFTGGGAGNTLKIVLYYIAVPTT